MHTFDFIDIEVFRLPSELRYISKIKDDEEVVKKKTGRQSNTPYWYHIQCKHLANKRKVRIMKYTLFELESWK